MIICVCSLYVLVMTYARYAEATIKASCISANRMFRFNCIDFMRLHCLLLLHVLQAASNSLLVQPATWGVIRTQWRLAPVRTVNTTCIKSPGWHHPNTLTSEYTSVAIQCYCRCYCRCYCQCYCRCYCQCYCRFFCLVSYMSQDYSG